MSHLFGKYEIKKSDGSPVDPDAQYFVLRIDTDVHAQIAVMSYAQSVEKTDYEFAEELRDWVIATRKAVEHRVQADVCLLGGLHDWVTKSNGEYTKTFCGKCGTRPLTRNPLP